MLRAEKGYIIVGQETDGTVTPHDLGMDWVVAKEKPTSSASARFSARGHGARRPQAAGRASHRGPERGAARRRADHGRTADGHPPMPMIGHVTSSYYSPKLGRSIALALVKDGLNRMDQHIFVPLPGKTVNAPSPNPCSTIPREASRWLKP